MQHCSQQCFSHGGDDVMLVQFDFLQPILFKRKDFYWKKIKQNQIVPVTQQPAWQLNAIFP